MQTVIMSIGQNETVSQLIPYIDGKFFYFTNFTLIQNIELIENEDDETNFAIAEELGKVFKLISDRTVFLNQLETLAMHDETVVREQATKSLYKICESLSEHEI